jgi:hypothetical protein
MGCGEDATRLPTCRQTRFVAASLRHDLEWKHFPTADLPRNLGLLTLAEQDAIDYLENMFREGPRHE